MIKADNFGVFFTLLLLGSTQVYGQLAPNQIRDIPISINEVAVNYANTITEDDLKSYLEILASDALEGRETGTRGQKMAATFIEQHFMTNALAPVVTGATLKSYKQEFQLYKSFYRQIYLATPDQKYHHMQDILFYGDIDIDIETSIELRFLGPGEVENYQGINVKNQIVAFFTSSRDDRTRKIKIAQEQGALGYFFINHDNKEGFQKYLTDYGYYFNQASIDEQPSSSGSTLMFFGHTELVAEMLSTSVEKLTDLKSDSKKNPLAKIKAVPVGVLAEKVDQAFTTENVLGYIEGSDKADELIVLTAHYDHEGINGDEVYNGADDDGSGTVAILEIAQAFALAKADGHGPRRSLLFMTVTGEEKGLLGSAYYTDHPIFPLQNTVANLNIDMIGRVDKEHESDDKYVYVIGADRLSQELHDISESVNRLYTNLNLDYKYNSKDDPNRFYYRSDHYNFAKHNIPIIFYFNGTHEDYHQPTDTVDKIRFDLLKHRADLVFYTAWELANREDRIQLK